MAVTREIFPGYKHSVSAWALLIFRDEMLRQLELDKAGFEVFDRYPGKPSPPVDEIIAGIEYPQQREAFAALIYGSSVEVLRKFFPDSDVASTIMARVRDADYDDEHSDN